MLYIQGRFEDREATAADVEAAIAGAAAALPTLRATPAHRRAAWLEAIAAGIRARRDALTARIVAEAKKPVVFARGEVDRAVSTFTFAAEEARRLGGEVIPIDAAPGGDGRIGIAVRVPRGVVAGITPFNFPLNLVAHKIAPAIACGAPIVLKPSPDTPETAVDLARVIHEAGVPPGAVHVVPCDTSLAGPLVEDPRVMVLSFTGSAKVGWEMRARASGKQVLLELGGNAAVIVMPDADWRAALPRIVTAAYAYAGQICIKLQRLLVHQAVYDEVQAALVEAIPRTAVVGDPGDEKTIVGPLIRTRDADRVMSWLDEAAARGARVLVGGTRSGDVIAPTLLADVPTDVKAYREEIFGPVLLLERFKDVDEAIERVNDSPYGLQAGVYTRDVGALMKAFRGLEVGAVIHDDAPIFRVDHMPYGGSKRSGTGREGPRYAIEEMTEIRLLVMKA